jgi:hypothetical protein
MGSIEFADQVMGFGTDGGTFNVLFTEHAAQYRVSRERGDFAALVAAVATAWRRRVRARFVVEGIEIIGVEPLPNGAGNSVEGSS